MATVFALDSPVVIGFTCRRARHGRDLEGLGGSSMIRLLLFTFVFVALQMPFTAVATAQIKPNYAALTSKAACEAQPKCQWNRVQIWG